MEEDVEKNAEFENIDYLKKIIISQSPTSLLRVLLCYRLQTRFFWVTWKKLMRIMQSLKIVTILRKEVVEKNVEFENSDNLTEEINLRPSLLLQTKFSLVNYEGIEKNAKAGYSDREFF